MKQNIFFITLLAIFAMGCSTGGSDKSGSDETEVSNAENNEVTLADLGIDESGGIPEGLPFGSKVPGIGARDVNGNQIDLYSALKDGPLIVTFYRGKWCPHCNKYMSNLRDSIALIRHMGAKLIAITPELRQNAEEMYNSNNLNFSIVSDYGNNIMNAFKVTYKVTDEYAKKIEESNGYTISSNNGMKETFLPVPATYIIDKSGTIVFKHFDYNYRNRPSIKELLEALRNIQ